MRSVKATCNVCKNPVTLDIGELTPEEAKQSLENTQTYNCSVGQHVELGRMSSYLDVDWTSVEDTPDRRPSDEDFAKSIIAEYGIENVFYLGSPEIGDKLGIKSLQTLKDLDHKGMGEFANKEFWFTRYDSPRGFRVYVRSRR